MQCIRCFLSLLFLLQLLTPLTLEGWRSCAHLLLVCSGKQQPRPAALCSCACHEQASGRRAGIQANIQKSMQTDKPASRKVVEAHGSEKASFLAGEGVHKDWPSSTCGAEQADFSVYSSATTTSTTMMCHQTTYQMWTEEDKQQTDHAATGAAPSVRLQGGGNISASHKRC
jgi:hypothetical protein